MDNIEKILTFIIEIEQLKAVLRKTRPVGLDRYENSAEHSWHVCLSALLLKDYANEPVDILKVIKMMLIHDLGEIDAGDTIIYASETPENKGKEEQGVKRLLELLPQEIADELMPLWLEFENGDTAEARYARAIDRVPPLLHNLHDDGHTWKKHNIRSEKVFGLNQRIELGSKALWNVVKGKLEEAVKDGILPE